MTLLRSLLFTIIVSVLLFPVSGIGRDFATVVYSVGDVRVKLGQRDSWETPSIGSQIESGASVQTFGRSSLLILKPDGRFFVVEEGATVRLNIYSEGASKVFSGNMFAALSRFFSKNRFELFSEVRSGSLYQEEWVRLLEKSSYSSADMKKTFELVNVYTKHGMWNRVSALLLKLKRMYPENPGFYQLSQQALSGQQPTVEWQVSKIVDGGKYNLTAGSELSKNDNAFIRFYRNEESFYYLFRSSLDKDRKWTTQLIYPDSIAAKKHLNERAFFAARKAPKETFYFPLPTSGYNMSSSGPENTYFWGWSCDGPLLDEGSVKEITQRVETHLEKKGSISQFVITMFSPDLCRSGFSIALKMSTNAQMTLVKALDRQ